MGLFNQILGAVSASGEGGAMGQMGGMVNTLQQLSQSSGANPDQMQSLLSVVGNFSRSALQEKEQNEGEEQVNNLVNQFSGLSANPLAVKALFSMPQLQQLVQVASDRTGLPSETIESALPTAVPLVLKVVQMGADRAEQNPLLRQFLDSDGDGDIDIADLMNLASKYM